MNGKAERAMLALRTLISLGIKPTELEMSHETEHELIDSMPVWAITVPGDFTVGTQIPATLCGIPVKVVD
jgi:hypothetical protein